MDLKQKGKLFIISAPAGTGKTTLVNRLCSELPYVKQSVSYTTRERRSNETDGEHYIFVDQTVFHKKQSDQEFLEWAKVFDHYYGTDERQILDGQIKGFDMILVIDVQGALKVKEKMESTSIFISPPSLEELEKRLLFRNTDSFESIHKRLKTAKEELKMALSYDYHFINDDIEEAYDILRSIIIAEKHKN
ncbi:MAG: guanylate kinase [Rhabdochlamydiaceae bacterium]